MNLCTNHLAFFSQQPIDHFMKKNNNKNKIKSNKSSMLTKLTSINFCAFHIRLLNTWFLYTSL